MGRTYAGLLFPFYVQRVELASIREAKVPTRLTGQTGQTPAFLLDLAPTGQTALPVWASDGSDGMLISQPNAKLVYSGHSGCQLADT